MVLIRDVDIMITIFILRIILVSEISLQNIAVLYYLIKDYKRNYFELGRYFIQLHIEYFSNPIPGVMFWSQ